MPSPPKPWEVGASTPAAVASSVASAPAPAPTTMADSSSAPSVPSRPASLATPAGSLAPTTALSPYGASPYASPYSRMGSAYTSPYSAYGSTYGAGGYGGYGSSYGSYGGMGGMYGGMGTMGGMGMPFMGGMDPNNPSLIQQVGSSTGQTFALIQSIVQTFGGFAQMLESTFMATQSSFFAMLGVAEQFGQLRGALGQVLGVFGLVSWLRSWWRGETNNSANMADDFRRFLSNPPPPNGGPPPPKPSKKPLLIFLLAVFGLPYLMHRLIKQLASRLPPAPQHPESAVVDPSKLSFARAAYTFATTDPVELALAKDEIVAILSTLDPTTGAEGEWWRGRTRDGREGWFPRNFVEIIKPKEAAAQPQPSKAVA